MIYLDKTVNFWLPEDLVEIRVHSKDTGIILVQDNIVDLCGKDSHIE